MRWVKLLIATNDIEAAMICNLLEGEGIPAQRRYRGVNHYLKIVMGPVVEAEILVPEEKMEEASLIIKTFSQQAE